uniref:Uncharacterized protein n=1 Tax=Oryza nivara TaxID=4536 RepID=A0A0E0GZ39_ORYNI
MAATSFMAGRSSGEGATQRRATPMTCSISSTSASERPRSAGSSTSVAPFRRRTQSTTCWPSGMVGSMGCFPIVDQMIQD